MTVIVALVVTLTFSWLSQGATEYGAYISPEATASIANITEQINVVNETTGQLEENVRKIGEGNLGSVFLIPDTVAGIFKLVIENFKTVLTIQTELAKFSGLPAYTFVVVYLILMLTLIFLIVSAVIKWKT